MKVLIVEDDPMVALINKSYLEQIGDIEVLGPVMYEKDIINILEKEDINIILLDVFLPEKSGIEILQSLRSKSFFNDVIMITAANNIEEIKKAFAYGSIDYLVKPFEFERFKEAINKYKIKRKLFNNDKVLTQSDIDTLIINKSEEVGLKLPKGLNKKTLDKVIEFLNENSKKIWTLREIAYEMKISNVTIKKYMDYLEKNGKVSSEISFGNIGRPEYKYSVIKSKLL